MENKTGRSRPHSPIGFHRLSTHFEGLDEEIRVRYIQAPDVMWNRRELESACPPPACVMGSHGLGRAGHGSHHQVLQSVRTV